MIDPTLNDDTDSLRSPAAWSKQMIKVAIVPKDGIAMLVVVQHRTAA
jgi:hypothetical protein